MTFASIQRVRFAHVDAAGIVFYPRYFEMLNTVLEEYFERCCNVGFARMHRERRIGVPTVKLAADFAAASRLGDDLTFTLSPVKVGRSSAEFAISVTCADERRFAGALTIVCTDLDRMRSVPWPDDLRPRSDQ